VLWYLRGVLCFLEGWNINLFAAVMKMGMVRDEETGKEKNLPIYKCNVRMTENLLLSSLIIPYYQLQQLLI